MPACFHVVKWQLLHPVLLHTLNSVETTDVPVFCAPAAGQYFEGLPMQQQCLQGQLAALLPTAEARCWCLLFAYLQTQMIHTAGANICR
jgi:hypothetical protein